jgi:hypothetical protein
MTTLFLKAFAASSNVDISSNEYFVENSHS